MTKDKILFFSSGDFAIDTFEMMVENGFNIVGLVTSNDKVRFHDRTISEIAQGHGIKTYVVKNDMPMENDEFFIDWLKRANADIFCVISFKKLPQKITRLAKKCAFNVHASLLPFLKGAAPINWAIRYGFKETGLTAFVLNDKIDSGDIIANTKVKISKDEKFTTLYKKLSRECVDFTAHVIDDVLQKDDWNDNLICQGTLPDEFKDVFNAGKINKAYFENCHWTSFTAQHFKRCVDSVDDIGFNCQIIVKDKNGKEKVYDAKIYDVEAIADDTDRVLQTESDGKTYIKINLYEYTAVLVKKIQIIGKKVMDVETFLNGFRYFREDEYSAYIIDLVD